MLITDDFLRSPSQGLTIQGSPCWLQVSGMQLERNINCIINQSKLNVFEIRKCMKTIAINYGNWWKDISHRSNFGEQTKLKKQLWSIIKSVINRNKKTEFQENIKVIDGSYTADIKIICEKHNDFFINVGPSLSNRIPVQNCSPDQYIKKKMIFLYLEPVTEAEIRRRIMSLKFSAPGYDDIRSSELKMSLPFICTPLTYIFNLTLQEDVFPQWTKNRKCDTII